MFPIVFVSGSPFDKRIHIVSVITNLCAKQVDVNGIERTVVIEVALRRY